MHFLLPKRYLQRIYLFGLGLLFSGLVLAQNNKLLTGQVLDSEGAVLASAQLVLLEGSTIKGYTLTDVDGKFELALGDTPAGALTLEVRMFGYATFSRPLAELKSPVNFRLVPVPIEFATVEVTADALPISQREDTLMFNTGSYTDGTEEKVEDMLKKLPGVEVDEQGTISVQGKAIDRVLIDGEDAFGRNYRLATQNINAGFVNRVDVISNFTEDQLTGDLDQNKELVLDLKLEDSRKKIIFGEVELAAGLPGGMDNDANVFMLSGKTKAVLFAQNNTLGQDPSSGIDMSYQVNGNSGVIASQRPDLLSTTTGYRPKSISPREYLRNEVYATAGSLILNPSKNLRSRTIYSLHNNLFRLNNQERLNFFSEDLPVTVDHFKLYRESERMAWLDSENSLNVAKNSRLDLNIKATITQQDMVADLTSTTDALDSDLISRLEGSPQQYNGRLRFTRRINDQLALRLVVIASHESNDQLANHLSDRYTQLFQNPLNGIRQSAREKTTQLDPHISVLYSPGKWFFDSRAGYRKTSGQVDAQAYGIDQANGINAFPDRQTSLRYDFGEVYLEQNLSRTFGKLKFSGGANFAAIQLNYRNQSVAQNGAFRNLIVQPNVALEYRFSSRALLNFNAGHRQELPAPNQLISVPYFSDHQTLMTGLDTLYLQQSDNIGLRYNYTNSFRQLSYYVGIQRTNIPNGLQRSLGVASLFTEQRLTAGFPSNSVQLRSGISKFVAWLNGNLDLKVNIMQFNNQLEVNGRFDLNRYQILDTRFTYLSTIREWLKLSLQAGYKESVNVNRGTVEQPVNADYAYNYGGGITASFKPKTQLSAKADGYIWKQNGQQTHTLLATFSADHTLPSGIKLHIEGTNLLNQGTFYQNYVNSYQVSQRSFLLRPRTLIFGISWSF
ncbi:TonB-dependent receptor [Neolewinella lacunae]|uniref:TonB-dependent receptor n=1 Tax=Neolewinella lacunae TaxID=1517758 RepID=A0A923PI77_9BACT|nr:TonB-dependent receptor [Neolewinella lacunae]MBC6993749.1 TonB-dependent receptor [Neolewinella lacunae]MDN3635250.1 TonB-dependent receptor [Neolewinella lacunae]